MDIFLEKNTNIFKFVISFYNTRLIFCVKICTKTWRGICTNFFAQKLCQASPMGSAFASRLCSENQNAISGQCSNDVTTAADFGTQCMRGAAACRCIANVRKPPRNAPARRHHAHALSAFVYEATSAFSGSCFRALAGDAASLARSW